MILANVALPTFFGHGIFLLIGLLPIAFIEGLALRKHIKNIQHRQAFFLAFRANLKSTIIGIPFAWISSLFISIPIAYLADLSNKHWGETLNLFLVHALYAGGFHIHDTRLSLVASTALLIPYYYISVFLEFGSIRRTLNKENKDTLKAAVIFMNRITYSILVFTSMVFFFIT